MVEIPKRGGGGVRRLGKIPKYPVFFWVASLTGLQSDGIGYFQEYVFNAF